MFFDLEFKSGPTSGLKYGFRGTNKYSIVGSSVAVRFWVNSNAMFIKHLLKRNKKKISAYLRDKQVDCFTFNIIQHHPTTKNNGSDKDVLLHLGRNK